MIGITQCSTVRGLSMAEFAQSGEQFSNNRVPKIGKNSPYLKGGDDDTAGLFDTGELYVPVTMAQLKSHLLKAFQIERQNRLSGTVPTDSKYSGCDGWMNWRHAARFLPCSVSDAPLFPAPTRKHDLEAYWFVEEALNQLVRQRKMKQVDSPVYRLYKTDDMRDAVISEFYENESLFALPGTANRKEG